YNKYEDVSESNTQAELIDAILATKSILASAEESISMYEKLNNAIKEHDTKLSLYINKSGRGDYEEAIGEAIDIYEEGKIETMEEVDDIIAKLDAALQACIQSDEIEEGADLTEYIQNPSFEDLSNQNDASSGGVAATPKGWNMYINGTQVSTVADINAQGVTGWCAINEGDAINVELEDGTIVSNQYSEGTHLWGIWNATIPEIELSQEISGLPAGLYTLTCDVLVQYNWAGNCLTTQRIFANDYVAMYSTEDAYENNLPDDAKIAAEIDALVPDAEIKHLNYAGFLCESPRSDYSNKVSLQFGLAEQGSAKIGFRTNNIISDGTAAESGLGWFKLDNWTLTYDEMTIPEGANVNADATSINDINNNIEKVAVKFYTIDGTQISAPQKGINIVKMSNGSVSKIFVK
ncbi:MAG: hypothetical protein K6E54_10290, partial [Bacteroidaceae bacterium]|nr:hypothetical protein [Bacteroidaceae bacterium]